MWVDLWKFVIIAGRGQHLISFKRGWGFYPEQGGSCSASVLFETLNLTLLFQSQIIINSIKKEVVVFPRS